MRILVTGGAGFIGSHLVELVLSKPAVERVVVLDCLTYAGHLCNLRQVERHPRYHFSKIDLRDRDAVAEVIATFRITHVLHLAAESHVDRSIAAPADFIHTNILGTFHLLEGCRAAWNSIMFRPTKYTDPWILLGVLRRGHRMHPIPPIQPPKQPAISWSGHITEPMDCPLSRPIAAIIMVHDNFRRS